MPSTNNKTTDFAGQPFFVGLDVHKQSWTVTVRSLGFEVANFSQQPDPLLLRQYLCRRFPGGNYFSAYEAGFSGTSSHERLNSLGIHNIIIHAGDLPQTDKQRNNKTDLHDSRSIARYLEGDQLRSIYVMPAAQQEHRSLFRLRQVKVKEVTRSTNRILSFLYYFGVELPDQFSDKKYFSNRLIQWLRSLKMQTDNGTTTLNHYLDDMVYHRGRLLSITKQLRSYVQTAYCKEFTALISRPGVGTITAIALLTEIGDFRRFNKPYHFTSYLGLCPAIRSSGERIYKEKIQPRCNKHLRPLLIEAAWVAIRKCPDMLLYYKNHKQKNEKKAIIKVARKLALQCRAAVLKQN